MNTPDREPRSVPYTRGSETSRLAAESVRGKLGRIQRQIYEYVGFTGDQGSTCDEAELALGLSHQTCSARFRELTRRGWLSKTLEKRKTRSGRGARVYITDRMTVSLSKLDMLDDLSQLSQDLGGYTEVQADQVGSLRRGSR